MIDGGSGNDFLLGDAGDDEIIAGPDSDFVTGGAGDDGIDGGDGFDRAFYSGIRANYEITQLG